MRKHANLPVWAAALLLTFVLSGCVRTKAKAAPDMPTLEVPPPPPRDVEPTESEPPQPMSLPQEPARNTPPRTRPTPPAQPQQRPTETRPAPTPEPPPATPPPEPPKPVEEPRPGATLQTTPTTAEAEVERTIRATIARANNDLNRIDYRALNADARTQYETAKGFIRQAESAIRLKNLVLAKTVADKAATIAAQLGGR